MAQLRAGQRFDVVVMKLIAGVVALREPVRAGAVSRDDFVRSEGTADLELPLGGPWRLRAGLGLEAVRYARPDSGAYFDYTLTRSGIALVWSADPRWSLAFGPRGERFGAVQAPEESHRELAAALEFEWLSGGAWWAVSPAGGWREMDEPPPGTFATSSYAFAQLDLFAEHPLGGGLAARASSSLRIEQHTDESHHAASLQLALEVRWRLR